MDKLSMDTLEMLEEQIKTVLKKGDISPQELSALKEAWELRAMIKCSEEMGDESSYDMMPRSYMMDPKYMDPRQVSYDGGSYRRGRSMTTGRYMSREDGYSSGGYSGHSIKDRMIARLESMYDEAKSEHEREEIQKEIRRIESEK